jgi:uncharacterized protein
VRILRAADAVVMPWKNGGGSTRELMIWPPGASLQSGFDWRISMADVGSSGPFSRFPGYDRLLMIVAGAGLVLTGTPGGPVRLADTWTAAVFSGDQEVSGELIDGPIRDFNLITRRAATTGGLRVIHVVSARRLATQGEFAFATVLRGNLHAEGQPLAPGDSLLLEPQEALSVTPGAGADAVLALAEIGRRAR